MLLATGALSLLALCAGRANGQVVLFPLLVQDQPVPGLPAGYTAAPAGNAYVNARGVLLIPAQLSGPGIVSGNNSTVELTGSISALSVVSQDGMTVPGAPSGDIISTQASNAMPTNSGAATVSITVTDPVSFNSNSAFWLGVRGAAAYAPGTPMRIYGSGDGAPAPISSATISNASQNPSLSLSGRYAGFVGLTGTGVTTTTNQAILTGTPGQAPIFAAREGDSAPGIPANEPGGPAFIYLRDQNTLNINSAGQILFRAQLVNSSGSSLPFNPTAIYRYEPAGGLTLVAREGNSPGSGTLTFGTQVFNEQISMNSSGAVAFQTQQGAGSGNFVVWAGAAGSLVPAAQSNSQAPGLPSGVQYVNTNGFSNTFDGLRIADNGSLAFLAYLTGTGVTSSNSRAIFTGPPGSVQSLARLGDQAPGAPTGAVFTSFFSVAINANGRVAFAASDSLSSGIPGGIWAQDNSKTLRKIARVGDTVSIGGVGKTISSLVVPATGTGSDGLQSAFSAGGFLVIPTAFTDGTTDVLIARLGARSDFNGDGAVTVQDIFDFLAAWFAHSPSADFNNSGTVTVQDIFDFLSAWFAGT